MKRRIQTAGGLRAGMAVVTMTLMALPAPPVSAVDLPVSYTTAFNNPLAGSYPIAGHLTSLIAQASPGADVRIAVGKVEGGIESLGYELVTTLRARSDLDIRVIVDYDSYRTDLNANQPVYELLKDAADYFYVCNTSPADGGCLRSDTPSSPVMHNKFVLISALVTGDKHVVAQSSANWTVNGLGPLGWHQDLLVVRNDAILYNDPTGGGYLKYWGQMANCADRVKPSVVAGSCTGSYWAQHSVSNPTTGNRAWFFPRNPANGDTVAEFVTNATCRPRTATTVDRIRIAMFRMWNRNGIVQALKNEPNCRIEVLLSINPTDDEDDHNDMYIAELQADPDITVRCLESVHNKFMTISDSQGPRVYTGSHNYYGGSDDNDDAILRAWDDTVAAQYDATFDGMYTTALTKNCAAI